MQKEKETDELLKLLNKERGRQAKRNQFKTAGGSKLKEFCRNGTREECARITSSARGHIHFAGPKPHTDVSLGDCSYLDTCRHMATCKFIHYEVDPMDAAKMRVCGDASSLDPFSHRGEQARRRQVQASLRVAIRQLRHPHVPDGGARQVPGDHGRPSVGHSHGAAVWDDGRRRDATVNVQVCMGPPARPLAAPQPLPLRASGAAGRRRDVPVGTGREGAVRASTCGAQVRPGVPPWTKTSA